MLRKLTQYFKPYLQEGICIAFSGGADSSLLLKTACLSLEESLQNAASQDSFQQDDRTHFQQNKKILAIIAETRLHPHEDTLQAEALARSMGAECLVLPINEFLDARIKNNPINRCYLCKHLLFSSIKETARNMGRLHVFDGTNQNDTKEYRPGIAALEELGIHSPLKEMGITKEQVRELSHQLGLRTFDKPSTPCLATRLPYGARLDFELLNRIHQGESILRNMGFYNVRLRFHEPLLRIEVDKKEFGKVLEQQDSITRQLKQLNFLYITLDLEGFRSGSMDIVLENK